MTDVWLAGPLCRLRRSFGLAPGRPGLVTPLLAHVDALAAAHPAKRGRADAFLEGRFGLAPQMSISPSYKEEQR
jgi:hypothetical protein